MERNIFADMDFLERGSLPECMQPEEKRITREEFRAAMHAAAENAVNNPKIDGIAKLVVPLTGMTFAGEMEEILFGKEED